MAKVQLAAKTVSGQRAERIQYALKLLMQMVHPTVAIEKLMDKFQVRTAQARNYLVAAKEILAVTPPVDLEERREQLRAAFGLAYVECMAKGSHGPAVRALRELALLDGVYPAHSLGLGGRSDAEDTSQDVADTDPALVRKRMADLLDRHRDRLEALRQEPAPQPKAETGKPPVDGGSDVN